MIGMSEAFASVSAAMVFWATVGVWGVGERALTVRRDVRAGARRSRSDAGSYYWILGGVLTGFVAGFALAGTGILRLPGPALWLVVGLTIAWAGMLLRWWSVLTLAELFTTRVIVREDQRVVRNGPYGFVRHPSYLGLLVLLLGLGLALGSAASAVVMVTLPTVGVVKRVRVEESALVAELGPRYTDYCEGRARLLPGVW
jgi:protein-S-isoprenylcysteine O-methyltransferase Ste14